MVILGCLGNVMTSHPHGSGKESWAEGWVEMVGAGGEQHSIITWDIFIVPA